MRIHDTLEENGIETRPFFYPIHEMPPYRIDEKFGVAEKLSKKGINLPSSVALNNDVTQIIQKFIALKNENKS